MNKAEKKVKDAIENVQWSLMQILELKDSSQKVSIFRYLLNKFKIAYVSQRLWTEKNELFFYVNSVRKWTDLSLLLCAGEALYELDDFDSAQRCFERVIEEQRLPNQDIRLRALMGRLECELSTYFDRPRNADLDLLDCAKASELRDVIMTDLNEASLDIQADIKSRFARADMVMSILAIKSEVAHYRAAFKSTS